jgi:non-ribosomal peptide synthetase component F
LLPDLQHRPVRRTDHRAHGRHWRNLLEALIADPQQRLSQLPLLDPAEQQHLLDSLGVEPGERRLDQCIHHLFAEQALARKDAPALTFAGQTLSYAELDARANRLAWALRERGSARRCGSVWRWSARWKWSSACWRFSRPAALMCRWTRNTRSTACAT